MYGEKKLVCSYFSVNEGLPSNETYAVYEDVAGNIWMGTDHGVVLYDGIEMKLFSTQNGLTHNVVFKIYGDRFGRIWFLTYKGGVCYYDGEKVITPAFNDALIEELEHYNCPYQIYIEEDSTVYLSTLRLRESYFKINRGKELEVISFSEEKGKTKSFIAHRNNEVLFPCFSIADSTIRFQKEGITYTYLNTYERSRGTDRLCFSKEQLGVSWVGTLNKLYLMKHNEFHIQKEFESEILAIHWDGKSLLVGTDNRLYHYSFDGDLLHLKGEYFEGARICHIAKDRKGNYWMAGIFDGVIQVPSLNLFEVELPIGSRKEFLSRYWLKGDTIQELLSGPSIVTHNIHSNILSEKLNLEQKRVEDICYQWRSDGICMYIKNWTTYGEISKEGTVLFEKKIKYAHTLRSVENIVPFNEDKIALTGRYGFQLLDNYKSFYHSNKMDGFRENVSSIYQKSDSVYYVGTLLGLYKCFPFNPKGDRIQHILTGRITKIIDFKGYIVVLTRGEGMYLLQDKDQQRLTVENGLPSNFCNDAILYGDDLLVGTNRGISKLKIEKSGEITITGLSQLKKLYHLYVNQIAVDYPRITIRSDNKVYYFLPDEKRVENDIKVHLLKVKVNGKEKWFTIQSEIKLQPNENNIALSYRANTLLDDSRITYKYRLNGVSSDWISTKDREIELNNLPAGNYHFEIMASGKFQFDTETTEVHFEIAPPLIHTPIFWVTTVVFGLTIFLGIWRWNHIQVSKKRENEKALSLANVNALKMQMNPHFVFNALNSIQYYIATNQKREANVFLALFSGLIRNILSQFNVPRVNLEEEIRQLKTYIQLEEMRLKGKFSWEINYDNQLSLKQTYIPPMLLQPLIENAIWHGLSNLDRDGTLKVQFTSDGNKCICEVMDNGVGFDPKTVSANSVGLENVKKRIALISEIEGEVCELKIKSNSIKENGKPSGTIIQLVIPQKF